MSAAGRGQRAFGALGQFSIRRPRAVITAWVAIALALNVLVPQLETVVSRDATAFIPKDTAAAVGFEAMDEAFGSGQAAALAFVIVEGDGPLGKADLAWYGGLAERLRAGQEHVADVQDAVSTPSLAAALVSPDREVAYLPVAVRHPVGSPEAAEDIAFLRAESAQPPAGLTASVTGDPATLVDINEELDARILAVTALSLLIIVGLLALIYRRVVTVLVPLVVIGVALAVARGSVALLGGAGLPVSTYTAAFLTALVLGAGTDYTVFLLARYHERLREGDDVLPAVRTAAAKVGPVVFASAATVAAGTACMGFTQLALFRTTGPAMAVAVAGTLAVSLTLTPALTALAGRRAGPARLTAHRLHWWAFLGVLVVRRPVALLATGLVLLLGLAAFLPLLDRSYDVRTLQPASSESAAGVDALARHFPSNELRADYLVLQAPRDLRSSEGLVALEEVAESVARVDGVDAVRGVTRPRGEPLEQAQLPDQLGLVGDQLRAAQEELAAGSGGVRRLDDGAQRLAAGSRDLADGAARADDGADRLAAGLTTARTGVRDLRSGAAQAAAGGGRLAAGSAELTTGLGRLEDGATRSVEGLEQVLLALDGDALCTADPVCRQAREGLRRVYEAERDQLLPGLSAARDGSARLTAGASRLASGLDRLQTGVGALSGGVDRLAAGAGRFSTELDRLESGAQQLADGASRLAPGVGEVAAATGELEAGLDDAAGRIGRTAADASAAGVRAFYLPPGALQDERFALAREFYLSADGRTARMLVYGETTDEAGAERRLESAVDATRSALRATPLAGTEVLATGPAAATRDLRKLADADLQLMLVTVLLVVFLTLVLLLRSLVAPIYLMATVLLNYVAALGLTVLVWQVLLGQTVDWTVPVLSFVLLVAVGVDYNILLVTRIREEAPAAERAGIARAVATTGGVITAAGVIFAGSFVAMLFTGIDAMAQNGFAIAAGLLLDTFLVRTLLVPAIAALLGRYNWWPGGLARPGRLRAVPALVQQGLRSAVRQVRSPA